MSSSERLHASPNPIIQWVKDEINNSLLSLNTMMPAVITAYSSSNNRANVKPAFKIRYSQRVPNDDGSSDFEREIPDLTNVPVVYLGGKKMEVSFDLSPGDRGILIFSQRSLEQWKQFLIQNIAPLQHSPKLLRKFSINDAVFLPCVIDKGAKPDGVDGLAEGALGTARSAVGSLLSLVPGGSLVSSLVAEAPVKAKGEIGGNRLVWEGQLAMQNENDSMLNIINRMYDDIESVRSALNGVNTVLATTAAVAAAGVITGHIGGALAANTVNLTRTTALKLKIAANKLKVKNMLK